MRTVSCRVETFLTTSAVVLCQPGPVQGPNESEVAEAEISSDGGGAGIDRRLPTVAPTR